MPLARIVALSLLLLSLACGGFAVIVAVSPFFIELELIDGTIATPRLGIWSSLVIGIPAVLMAAASGSIWFIVRPEQRVNRMRQAELNRLRELSLQLYRNWLLASDVGLVMTPTNDSIVWRQEAALRARQLFADLDPPRKRQLLQLLADLNLLQGEMALNLRGVDLHGTDLCTIDLRNAVLVGVNLLGANVNHARLDGADLRETQITPAQLASAASVTGARIDSSTDRLGL